MEAEVLTSMQDIDNDKGTILPQKPQCRLLVSAQNLDEAVLVLECGADWLDLKDPSRGALGRPPLPLVSSVAKLMEFPSKTRWSIAGGELLEWDFQEGQPYLDVLGTGGAIKWALAGCRLESDWISKAESLADSLADRKQTILVHYADYVHCDAPNWDATLGAAKALGLSYLLCDTFLKNGCGLLDYCDLELFKSMIREANMAGIAVAIAGSLKLEQLGVGDQVGAAWVGVRGAVCSDSGRSSPISHEKLKRAVAIVRGSGTTKHPG